MTPRAARAACAMVVAAAAALTAAAGFAASPAEMPGRIVLEVPIVAQRPERCGPAALAMVLRFHGATREQVAFADSAYDPALHGALITDLAAWARRAGFEARVARLSEDSLRVLLRERTPPVLLYRRGFGPVAPQHYGVLVGWDPGHQRWILHDGGRGQRRMSVPELAARWGASGREALVVRKPGP